MISKFQRRALGAFLSLSLLPALLGGCGGPPPLDPPETTASAPTEPQWPVHYQVGLQYLENMQYDKAIELFTLVIEENPLSTEAYIRRGSAYYLARMSGEYTSAAQADYHQALTLEPGNVQAWLGLADIDLRQGSYRQAIETLETALEYTGQSPEIQSRLADFRQGIFEDSFKNRHMTSYFDPQGKLLWYVTFTYVASDSSGSKRIVTSFDDQGQELCSVTEVYDPEGRPLIQAEADVADGFFGRSELSYNDAGRIQRVAQYDAQEQPIRKTTYLYNEAGQLTRMDFADFEDGAMGYRTFEYNDQGLMSLLYSYDENSSLRRKASYQYDSQGRPIRVDTYSPQDQLLAYFVRSYDETGGSIHYYDGDGTLLKYRLDTASGITWYDADGTPQDSLTYK